MSKASDNQLKSHLNTMPKTDDLQVSNMSEEEMAKAHAFIKVFPSIE